MRILMGEQHPGTGLVVAEVGPNLGPWHSDRIRPEGWVGAPSMRGIASSLPGVYLSRSSPRSQQSNSYSLGLSRAIRRADATSTSIHDRCLRRVQSGATIPSDPRALGFRAGNLENGMSN